MSAVAASPAPGFADAIHDTQQVFRRLLDAFTHPGRVIVLPQRVAAPDALWPSCAALALTLFDHSTPVHLDPVLDTQGVRDFLRFHCGAPLVEAPIEASFALVGNAGAMDLADFAPGDGERPERSTTVLLQVTGFLNAKPKRLAGPGIATTTTLIVDGTEAKFWQQWRENGALYPGGVDVVLAAPEAIAALPRTVRVED
ncbi:MAG TPA: phosphonate C-P lyase system protein PhnH [Stellaceae bacterium]|nr:phosphonate C-P lyase system protein PhnH [Stellaceae bacterium]